MDGPVRILKKRPGSMSPVFFFALLQLAQLLWAGVTLAAQPCIGPAIITPGYPWTCRHNYQLAGLNQAALGQIEQSSVSLGHSRPFLLGGPAYNSFSIQIPANGIKNRGAGLGLSLASCGVEGLHFNELWLSSGLVVHEKLSLGLGIHAWHWSTRGRPFHSTGISFSLSMLLQASTSWNLGLCLLHPMGWISNREDLYTIMALGFRWECFEGIRLLGELHSCSEYLTGSLGLEWETTEKLTLRFGYQSFPPLLHTGLIYFTRRFRFEFSSGFSLVNGQLPALNLHYVW